MIVDFAKGIIVGLCASIPLGPLGVLCVQRTLSLGRNSGFFTGLGTAIADTLFATIALFSLSFVNDFFDTYRNYILLIGGFIIAIIGVSLMLKNPVRKVSGVKSKKRYAGDLFSALLMTISNPGALVLLFGVFAFVGVDVGAAGRTVTILVILSGVFLGAVSWWFFLTTVINTFRARFRLSQLLLINRISGIIIAILGLLSIIEAITRFLGL